MRFLYFLILINYGCFGSSSITDKVKKKAFEYGMQGIQYGVKAKEYLTDTAKSVAGKFSTIYHVNNVLEKNNNVIFNPTIGMESNMLKSTIENAPEEDKTIILESKIEALKIKSDSEYKEIYLYSESKKSKNFIGSIKEDKVKVLPMALSELIRLTEQVKNSYSNVIDNPYTEESREIISKISNAAKKDSEYEFAEMVISNLIDDKTSSIKDGYRSVIENPLTDRSLDILSTFNPFDFEYQVIKQAIIDRKKYDISDVEEKLYKRRDVALDDDKGFSPVEDKPLAYDSTPHEDVFLGDVKKDDAKTIMTREVGSYNDAIEKENKELIDNEIKDIFSSGKGNVSNMIDSIIETSFANTGKIDSNIIANEMIKNSPELKAKYDSIANDNQRENFKKGLAKSLEKPLASKQKALEFGNWSNSELKNVYASNVESGIFERDSNAFQLSNSKPYSDSAVQHKKTDKKKHEKKAMLSKDEQKSATKKVVGQVLFVGKNKDGKKNIITGKNKKISVDKKSVKKIKKQPSKDKVASKRKRQIVYIQAKK
jgi:hypothetical protein